MKIIILGLWLAVMATSASAADLFTDPEKQKMMQLTLDSFWGKAIDSKGKPVQPKDDRERATIPISRAQSYYLINKGGESGLAEWCGVDWQERYLLILKQLRKYLTTDTQVAYAGVLHGVAQGMVASGMKGEACDAETKGQIDELVKEDLKNLKQALNEQ